MKIQSWLVCFFIIAGCASILSTPKELSTSTFLSLEEPSTFTYSTFDGQILQVNASGQKRQIIPAEGTEKWFLKWSPDRTRLAYVVAEFPQGDRTDTLWVMNADGSEPRSLFGPAKALRYSWQKDGQTIYFEEAISFGDIPFDKDTVIQAYIVDIETGSVQEVERRTELFPLPKESPDGERAIWNDPDDEWALYLLDSQNNKLSVIYESPPGRVISGVWAPDSQKLAIIRPEDEEIYLYEIDTGDWLKVSSLSATHQEYRIGNLHWSPDGKRLSYTLSDKEYVNQICMLLIEEQSEQCFDTRWISNEYVWSSDSNHIAYLSRTPSEEVDIFVIDISEGAIRNLTGDGNSIIEERVAR